MKSNNISMQMDEQTCNKRKGHKNEKEGGGKRERKKIGPNKHSHTAASTGIKTRRQISTWDWLNLQK